MPVWQWLVDSAGAILLAVVLYGLLLVVRRRVLSRQGGTFELSVRVRPGKAGRGWVLGLGRYDGDRLQWFRIFSPLPRPKRTFERSQLAITGQREPNGPESFARYGGHVIVECRGPAGVLELAMSPSALMGFSSWLEASPPGSDWNRQPVR